jgi:hypothetical protein
LDSHEERFHQYRLSLDEDKGITATEEAFHWETTNINAPVQQAFRFGLKGVVGKGY